jgi:acetoin utilization deacetylase AcuC-like enzyme
MGFCIFNNVAIAAEHLVQHHGLTRVAIVDFDVHHGNGTQHVFEARHDVFYMSVHERPGSIGFPNSGEADECGIGAGHGFTLNVPLNFGSQEAQYRAAFEDHILPALDRYRPEALLVSAGFDALSCDRVSHVSLEPESYGWITARLVDAADRHSDGRLISVLEGGYDLAHLGKAVATHVKGLMPSNQQVQETAVGS